MSEIDRALLECDNIEGFIAATLREDIGDGDVTSNALVDTEERVRAHVVTREELVVATGSVAELVFRTMEVPVTVKQIVADGDKAVVGDVVLEFSGSARAILTAERTILNLIQRMSGVSTLTRRYVEEVSGCDVKILDTRKTTPGLRALEKYAVLCGGGTNHRMGLYDMAMIKDNHRAFWEKCGDGGLVGAVEQIRRVYPDIEVEVEVDNEDELKAVLPARPEWILLDNMSLEQLRRCVALNAGLCRLEASGGIMLNTVRTVAETGVDAISIGALTHSAPAVDLALDFE